MSQGIRATATMLETNFCNKITTTQPSLTDSKHTDLLQCRVAVHGLKLLLTFIDLSLQIYVEATSTQLEHTRVLWPFVRDYPGEPVLER